MAVRSIPGPPHLRGVRPSRPSTFERKRHWLARTGWTRTFTRSLVLPRTLPTLTLRRLTGSSPGSTTLIRTPGMLLRRRSSRTFPKRTLCCPILMSGSSMTPSGPWAAARALPRTARAAPRTAASRTSSAACSPAARPALRRVQHRRRRSARVRRPVRRRLRGRPGRLPARPAEGRRPDGQHQHLLRRVHPRHHHRAA